jgi:hypothetical protein
MKNTKITITLALSLLAWGLLAGDGDGGQAGAFLRIPVGERAIGMGDAFTAIADDAHAFYWNPGGMYQVDKFTLGSSYSLLSLDRHHYTGVIVCPLNQERLTLMWNKTGVSDIDGRDEEGLPTQTFDDSEMSLGLGYTHAFNASTGLGMMLKYLHHSLEDSKASGIGIDLGFHKRIGSLRLGMSVSNLLSSMEWDIAGSEAEEIPFTIRGGLACDIRFGKVQLTPTVEFAKTTDETISLHAGAEAGISQYLKLRAGYSEDKINYGASVIIQNCSIGYAYSPDFLGEGATSIIGLHLGF